MLLALPEVLVICIMGMDWKSLFAKVFSVSLSNFGLIIRRCDLIDVVAFETQAPEWLAAGKKKKPCP